MAVTATPVFVQTPKITPIAFTNSDSANTKKTVFTAGTNNSKVNCVLASSTDTSARIGQLWLTRSATSYLLGSISVSALSGSDGTVATADMLATLASLPRDNDGQRYIFMESGDTLQVSFTTQVTSAKEVDVVAQGAHF